MKILFILLMMIMSAHGRVALQIDYEASVEVLQALNDKIKAVKSLPIGQQHERFTDKNLKFETYILCFESSCTLKFSELAEEKRVGAFSSSIIVNVDINYFQKRIQILHFLTENASASSSIFLDRIFSQDDENANYVCNLQKSSCFLEVHATL